MWRPSLVRVEARVLVDDYSGFTELLGEHGISVLITLVYDDGSLYQVLLDTGRSGRVLLENSRVLGVDLARVNAIVLSHRHHDHTGGLPSLAGPLRGKPVIAHPDLLKPCYAESRGFTRFTAGLTPDAREALRGFELVLVKEPLELAPNALFLGEITRHYDNSYAVKGFKTVRNGELVDEHMLDDTGIAVKLGSRVLVVAGCSHSGIQNIVRQARKLTGASEAIVLGGLHLAGADQADVKRVVEELLGEGVVEVHAGHCTGLTGEAELMSKLGKNFHKIHSGYYLAIKVL